MRTGTHTRTERQKLAVYLSSLNTSSRWPQKVCISRLIYINEVQRMQPDVFTFAKKKKKKREREKKITAASAARLETFQLKCNFHPHCCRMKPGKQQKKKGTGWDMTEKILGVGMGGHEMKKKKKKQAARRNEWRTDEKEDLKSVILQNENPNWSWWTTITQTWRAERRGGKRRTKTKKLDSHSWTPPFFSYPPCSLYSNFNV